MRYSFEEVAMEAHVEQQTSTVQRSTLPLYNLGCGGAGALGLERTLRRIPGVRHVYVNPATEMAYVAYDAAQVDVPALTSAVKRAGYGAPGMRSTPQICSAPLSPAQTIQHLDSHIPVPATNAYPAIRHSSFTFNGANSMISFVKSRKGMVLLAVVAIAGYYLATAHTAHVTSYLPYALILLCPLMHLFMHGGHGNHAGHESGTLTQIDSTDHDHTQQGHTQQGHTEKFSR
jgi:cation transport ATPase